MMFRFRPTRMGGLLISACAVAAVAVAAGRQQADAQILAVGVSAPAYALPDQNGAIHTLAGDKGKTILLAFYPADFTGGCTREAHALSQSATELKAMGVQVYGVSVQDPKSHKAFCEKEGIPYTLLADTEHVMSRDYGVLIPAANVANRVTYIVAPSGKIVYVDANVNSHLATCGADWIAWLKAHPQTASGLHQQTAGSPRQLKARNDKWFNIIEVTPMPQGSILEDGATISYGGVAELGKPAPAFSVPDVSTGTVRDADFTQVGRKATVLLFVATRCPVSNAYNERMIALAKQYAPKGVAFVGIDANQNEPVSECAAFVKAKAFPFAWLKDATDAVADAYDAHSTPEAYVIDAKGVLVYHGRIDDNMDASQTTKPDLANALRDVLAGRPVARARTIAFGCSIKRGE